MDFSFSGPRHYSGREESSSVPRRRFCRNASQRGGCGDGSLKPTTTRRPATRRFSPTFNPSCRVVQYHHRSGFTLRTADIWRTNGALPMKSRPARIRRQSAVTLAGLPLFQVAIGPDPEKGEVRGHAHAIIAIGDIATGCLAVGGIAIGILAIGGCAIGGISLGGVALGLLAVGGLAVGGVSIGGAAVGIVAVGGFAIGYYACGGAAIGTHVVSPALSDPEAVRFFQRFLPCLLPRQNQ